MFIKCLHQSFLKYEICSHQFRKNILSTDISFKDIYYTRCSRKKRVCYAVTAQLPAHWQCHQRQTCQSDFISCICEGVQALHKGQRGRERLGERLGPCRVWLTQARSCPVILQCLQFYLLAGKQFGLTFNGPFTAVISACYVRKRTTAVTHDGSTLFSSPVRLPELGTHEWNAAHY